MLDASIAGSERSPTHEPPPNRVGQAVCSTEDHETLREWVRFARALKIEAAGWLPEMAKGWLKTSRPWPDAGLAIGECPSCRSTLAICAVHVDCDGASDDHDVAEVE